MPEIENEGATIHYRIDGPADAPTLMFSNSLGTALAMWDGQVDDLAGRYRILRYDSRGHGRSSAPAGSYTIDMLGRDALAVMDAAGADTVHYCGLSKGGMVGMWLGVNAADRLERLVLADTAPHMAPKDIWDERAAAARGEGMTALVDATIERWFTEGFRATRPEVIEKIRGLILSTPGAGYAGCCEAIRDMDQRAAIRAIAVPTLVVVGEKDPATPPEAAAQIHDSIAGSELVVIPDAAHLSNIEQQGAFSAAIEKFFG